MARTSEQPEGTENLPRPETNPLLNPLLSDNMGRWAEVYFTNPPERREEAVLELLRELEREQRQAGSSPASAPTGLTSPAIPSGAAQTVLEDRRPDLRFCGSCGHENPVEHQFCGMCGARIHSDAPKAAPHDFVDQGNREVVEIPLERAEPVRTGPERSGVEAYVEPEVQTPAAALHPPAVGSNISSLFESFRSAESEKHDWNDEPTRPNPYRFYIVALLVMVIGGLGYMAWRGSLTTHNSSEASPPPVATASDAAQMGSVSSPAANSPGPMTPKATRLAAAPTAKMRNAESSRNSEIAKAQVGARTPPVAAKDTHRFGQISSAGGAEELAMAEHYLNGSAGQGRDSSEAAAWLWKSIAKHNSQATLLLADLYLRGDGVSKNCDQARVLLDAAAGRGVAGAGERLRNLEAFGCP